MADNGTLTTVVRTSRGLTVAGTRITLYDILDYLKADWPASLIQHWFDLSEQQIADVMTYLAAHRDEVEDEYQIVVRQAAELRAYWEERNHARLARLGQLPQRPGQEAVIAKLRARKAELGLV